MCSTLKELLELKEKHVVSFFQNLARDIYYTANMDKMEAAKRNALMSKFYNMTVCQDKFESWKTLLRKNNILFDKHVFDYQILNDNY